MKGHPQGFFLVHNAGVCLLCHVTADTLLANLIEAARRKALADASGNSQPIEPLPLFVPDRGGKNHLIRLDVAIMCVYICALRIASRGIPAVFRGRIAALKASAESSAAGFGVKKLVASAWKGIGKLVTWLQILGSLFQGAKLRGELQKACASAGQDAIDEIRVSYMGAGKLPHRRKKHTVGSRHPQPRQRRRNKSWKPQT